MQKSLRSRLAGKPASARSAGTLEQTVSVLPKTKNGGPVSRLCNNHPFQVSSFLHSSFPIINRGKEKKQILQQKNCEMSGFRPRAHRLCPRLSRDVSSLLLPGFLSRFYTSPGRGGRQRNQFDSPVRLSISVPSRCRKSCGFNLLSSPSQGFQQGNGLKQQIQFPRQLLQKDLAESLAIQAHS